ncbi:hypothetical protein [Paenibacillus campi]|uniref:hypothetical protein n=1 Tax=Paenibacillus campi TaxID=3106031 RepID=UPI002AFFF7EA|nr:hypothetical protein [Paenibacillus sp. SGZ-1014]
MKMVKSLLREWFTWKWLLVYGVLLLMSNASNRVLMQNQAVLGAQANIWDRLLLSFSHTALLVYVMMPFSILLSVMVIQRNLDHVVRIRCQSWCRWIIWVMTEYLPVLSMMLLCLVCSVIVWGSVFRDGHSWSAFADEPSNSVNWFSALAAQSGMPPIVVIVIHIVQLAFFLMFVHLILTLIQMLVGRKYSAAVAGGVVYVYIALASHYFPLNGWNPIVYMSASTVAVVYHSYCTGLWIMGCMAVVLASIACWMQKR